VKGQTWPTWLQPRRSSGNRLRGDNFGQGKLMALPTPLVAHVEHDHFIAITRITKSQVYYNCSDCGYGPVGSRA